MYSCFAGRKKFNLPTKKMGLKLLFMNQSFKTYEEITISCNDWNFCELTLI